MNVIHLRQLYRSLYSPGLHPEYCRKTREKWLGDEKPRYKDDYSGRFSGIAEETFGLLRFFSENKIGQGLSAFLLKLSR